MVRQWFGFLWNGLLDLVFPPHCLICEQENEAPVCVSCRAGFLPVPEPICSICGKPIQQGEGCSSCPRGGNWGFDAARACGLYAGSLREAILLLKYRGAEGLSEPLGQFLTERFLAEGFLPEPLRADASMVVPVPLHPSRHRERGYNQAERVAQPLSRSCGLPILTEALRRTRRTRPQVGLAAEARRRNVTTEDFIAEEKLVRGQGILLVDDVYTTGATLSACGAALRQAGARRVVAVALALGK